MSGSRWYDTVVRPRRLPFFDWGQDPFDVRGLGGLAHRGIDAQVGYQRVDGIRPADLGEFTFPILELSAITMVRLARRMKASSV